tara:strand:+ start:2749 stop:2964 length:216 start_codon:yes stop_codon:yes gene_type:complete
LKISPLKFEGKFEKFCNLVDIKGQRFFSFELNLNGVQVELKIKKSLPSNIHQIAKLFKYSMGAFCVKFMRK